jgi:hypothetical protein
VTPSRLDHVIAIALMVLGVVLGVIGVRLLIAAR